MLTRETFTGPWAGLPVAWNEDGSFDEETYRGDVRRCCEAGIPGVYTGGTTGEFYAIEIDEFAEISGSTIEECHLLQTPAMIGVSATSTRGAVRRAEIAAALGADAIQVTLPFWMEVRDKEVVSYFQSVSEASGGMPFSIYETLRCKKSLKLEQHERVKGAVPSYLMVKANAGTVGVSPEGCSALSKLVNVFAGEPYWENLADSGVAGACSAMVYWNPELILDLWERLKKGEQEEESPLFSRIDSLHQFLGREFGARGFTDTAYDRLCGVGIGILRTSLQSRGPYPSPVPEDVGILRSWCEENFPEILS